MICRSNLFTDRVESKRFSIELSKSYRIVCKTMKFDAKESKLFADFTFCPNKISPESIEPITFVKRTIILLLFHCYGQRQYTALPFASDRVIHGPGSNSFYAIGADWLNRC